MTSPASARSTGIGILVTLSLVYPLTAHLTSRHTDPGAPVELADLLLGESRQLLSRNFFTEADTYFHKGVEHKVTERILPGPFQRWKLEITPELHAHAEGEASAEILPWLKLAIRTDPHNVEAFLVAAFWADSGLNRPDLAVEILREAQQRNPADYRIPIERGRLAITSHQFDQAMPALNSALTLHARTPATPDRHRELRLDKATILTFLGFLHEIGGETFAAIGCFKEVLTLDPHRSSIKERLVYLESGSSPPETARHVLEGLMRRSVHDTCKEAEDDHTGHNHADHDGQSHTD